MTKKFINPRKDTQPAVAPAVVPAITPKSVQPKYALSVPLGNDVLRGIIATRRDKPILKFLAYSQYRPVEGSKPVVDIKFSSGASSELSLDYLPGGLTDKQKTALRSTIPGQVTERFGPFGLKIYTALISYYIKGQEFITINDLCNLFGYEKHHRGGHQKKNKDRVTKYLEYLFESEIYISIKVTRKGVPSTAVINGPLLIREQTFAITNKRGVTNIKGYQFYPCDVVKREIESGQFGFLYQQAFKLSETAFMLYNYLVDLLRIKINKPGQVIDGSIKVSFRKMQEKGGFRVDPTHPKRSITALHTDLDNWTKNFNPPLLIDWHIQDKDGNTLTRDWWENINWSGRQPLAGIVYWFKFPDPLLKRLTRDRSLLPAEYKQIDQRRRAVEAAPPLS